jgi:hypothetical protein
MKTYKEDMTHEKNHNVIADEMVEQQVARHMTDLLNDRAQRLTLHQQEHLQTAREEAVNYLAQKQALLQHSAGVAAHGNVLRWFGSHFGQQHRTASAVLVVLTMLFTFLTIQKLEQNNQIENSDAFLLASELPPEAYADKGFDAWLDSN